MVWICYGIPVNALVMPKTYGIGTVLIRNAGLIPLVFSYCM